MGPVMQKLIIASIAATACLFTALGASADGAAEGKGELLATAASFASLDLNSDHRISRSEAGFDRELSQTFAEIDTDGDGFVSTTEYAAAEKNRTTVSNLSNR